MTVTLAAPPMALFDVVASVMKSLAAAGKSVVLFVLEIDEPVALAVTAPPTVPSTIIVASPVPTVMAFAFPVTEPDLPTVSFVEFPTCLFANLNDVSVIALAASRVSLKT